VCRIVGLALYYIISGGFCVVNIMLKRLASNLLRLKITEAGLQVRHASVLSSCHSMLANGSMSCNLSQPISGNGLARHIHVSSSVYKFGPHNEPKEWPRYNDILYPPQAPGEPRRPAEIVHFRPNIKYSTKKLWYIACMIRGMTVDEALKQLSFYERKGSVIVKEVIQEAQEMAVKDHNVEYRSNLWIEDSFVRRAKTVYGLRRHAKGRYGRIHYRYTHYFLRLREGRPPSHYHPPRPTGHEMMEGYLQGLRQRTVQGSL